MSTYTNVNWITVDDHGATSGNGYVSHTAEPFTGRVQRRGYTTITSNSNPKILEFVQSNKPEFISFDEVRYDATAGGSLTITGRSNSPRMAFSCNGSFVTLPQYFEITEEGAVLPTEEQDTTGQVFVGDPGATAEFAFEIVLTITANTTLTERSCVLTAVGSKGVVGTTEITQAAAASFINLTSNHENKLTVTFDENGFVSSSRSVDVDVYSNDRWEMSIDDQPVMSGRREWYSLNNHNDWTDNGQVTLYDVENHTGRVNRREVILLTTYGGASAQLTISQNHAALNVEIDHIEDDKGNHVLGIGDTGGLFYIVGYSNATGIVVEETSLTECTDVNDNDGVANINGMVVVEKNGDGMSHVGVAVGGAMPTDYGKDASYKFKIPFVIEANSGESSRTIAISVSNPEDTETDSVEMTQAAPQES